ncbi:hypothetical protein [Pedobacter metabolipauper]|uniref:hypothetical protein n=1 Tax=Pedobacter metabolipauper TaxID=425513 RepID=UPI00105B983B|nr:hypothetical protein [Pedobacter metabolipauper]
MISIYFYDYLLNYYWEECKEYCYKEYEKAYKEIPYDPAYLLASGFLLQDGFEFVGKDSL